MAGSAVNVEALLPAFQDLFGDGERVCLYGFAVGAFAGVERLVFP
jgi:hypothetical protein